MKDEKLEKRMGLYYDREFFEKAEERLKDIKEVPYSFVAIDLEHFHLFNKLYGRDKGDELLLYIAGCIKKAQDTWNCIGGYLGGDNFGILMPARRELLEGLQTEILAGTELLNNNLGFLPVFGVYPISDTTMPAVVMYDRAAIALRYMADICGSRICEYNSEMAEEMESELRLISEVQKALEREEFTFYVQPQCDISTGKIVGAESLVRWKHHEKGMILPGVFIPVLEKNGGIADLDSYIWEKVCQWLQEWISKGNTPVPLSVNVSRIDIFSMDVAACLIGLLKKYELQPGLLKVEITESAYAENDDRVKKTVKQLRDAGLMVMMDDFGSGCSSLNMLKSVAVDVLKIDMQFLDIQEKESEKGISILESVVNMSRQMGLPIIIEGVETQKQEEFLSGMGCRYTQGYYYYKPLPIEEFEKLLLNKRNLDTNGFWCRQVEALHTRELFDSNLFSDTMLNNILGPAAFYDIYEDKIEIIRVNEQYYRLAGRLDGKLAEEDKRLWNHVPADDQPFLLSMFEQAYSNPLVGSKGYIRYLKTDGRLLWIYLRLVFLREKEGHKIFYGSLTDVSRLYEEKGRRRMTQEHMDDRIEKQRIQMEEFYDDLPCGFSVAKILMNEKHEAVDYEIVYANHEMEGICGGDIKRLRLQALRVFSGDAGNILERCYRAAFCGERVDYYTYSKVSNRYLKFTFFQYEYGYVGCLLQDETYSHIYEDALKSTLKAYREVYFVQLEDNYYRMIYPDESYLLERGNYEESINRHFGSGKIAPYDEINIRKFLSLDKLKLALKEEDTIEYKYLRRMEKGQEEWCLTNFMVAERKEDGTPRTAVMTIRSIDALLKEEEERQKLHITELLATMSDGFFIYRAEEGEKILYANPTVLRMYGCKTMKEFREYVGNSFRGMVHPEDVDRIEQEITEQIRNSSERMDYIEYRIIRKDGEVRYINDWGHLETSEEDNKLFYVIIKDVTDSAAHPGI